MSSTLIIIVLAVITILSFILLICITKALDGIVDIGRLIVAAIIAIIPFWNIVFVIIGICMLIEKDGKNFLNKRIW